MVKEDVVYTIYTMEYFSSVKKNGILTFAIACMSLEQHSEIS